jgi:hypothetical protein
MRKGFPTESPTGAYVGNNTAGPIGAVVGGAFGIGPQYALLFPITHTACEIHIAMSVRTIVVGEITPPHLRGKVHFTSVLGGRRRSNA